MSPAIPTRPLGKTGAQVSILCLGGWHIGQLKEEPTDPANARGPRCGHHLLRQRRDYHEAERRVDGQGTRGGKRDKVFLMTKNCGPRRGPDSQHLEDSLRRLATDRLDLWQFHEINYDNDPEWLVEKGAIGRADRGPEGGPKSLLATPGTSRRTS